MDQIIVEKPRGEDPPFAVWMGNLARYAEGKLEGEWIALPQDEGKLQEAVERIAGEQGNETIIMDVSFRKDCGYMEGIISEWSSMQQLNAVAKLIGNEPHPAVEAFVSCHPVTLQELADLLLREGDIPYYPYKYEGSENPEIDGRLSMEQKMGYTLLENDIQLKSLLDTTSIGSGTLANYINVEAIGRDCRLSGKIELYPMGYLDKQAKFPIGGSWK